MQQVMIRMPADLHERVKEVAASLDLTMAQAVRAAIRHYVEDPVTVPVHTCVVAADG